MSPEDRLQQAVRSAERIEAADEVEAAEDIDRILRDLEQVFEALQPELQEQASELIDKLQDKRSGL